MTAAGRSVAIVLGCVAVGVVTAFGTPHMDLRPPGRYVFFMAAFFGAFGGLTAFATWLLFDRHPSDALGRLGITRLIGVCVLLFAIIMLALALPTLIQDDL